MKHKYGYKRGLVDIRDHKFAMTGDPATLPKKFTLAPYAAPVFDQGQLGSCTANAISGALKLWMNKNNYKWKFTPSRLQIYYDERALEGTTDQDSGAVIRDGFKVINTNGVCPEDSNPDWSWVYDISKFTIKPDADCYKDAALHKCLSYAQVNQDEHSIKAAIYSGQPLIIGISCFSSFESDDTAKTGIIQLPQFDEQLIGGHALQADAYDDSFGIFGNNSFGTRWGAGGRYGLGWEYLLNPNLCSDIWTVGLIT